MIIKFTNLSSSPIDSRVLCAYQIYIKYTSDHPLVEASRTCASDLLSLCRRCLNEARFNPSTSKTLFTAFDIS